MGLTVRQIRDNTTRARHLMQRARKQGFAVGAFNIDNQETLIAICRAAQKLNSPVIVQLSDGEVKSLGMENVRDLVDNYKLEYGIEMYINLDHSHAIDDCKRAIDTGYEFVHIDLSQPNKLLTDEEIINKTQEVVEYAKFTGALVDSDGYSDLEDGSKVDFGSDLRRAFRIALERELRENPDEFVVNKLMDDVKVEIQTVVEEKINSLGSAGRAVV